MENKSEKYQSYYSILFLSQPATIIDSSSKPTIRQTGNKYEDEEAINILLNQKNSERGARKNKALEDNSEVGAPVQFDIRRQNDYGVSIIVECILHNYSKIIIVNVYNNEDTMIDNDGIGILSQHHLDNFHLIQHSRMETLINNFNRGQFEGNSLKISSSCSAKTNNWTSDLLFIPKNLLVVKPLLCCQAE
jgi:hypothetical protein